MRVFVISLTAILVTFGAAWGGTDEEPIHERIEWSDIWIENAESDENPRVFLVGDSIVKGYYDGVKKRLGNDVSLARYATSKFAGNPDYLEELGLILRRYDFDVVHINNGLHGWGYAEEQYEAALRDLVELVKRDAPDATVIWCMSTPVREKDYLEQFNERNERVIARNEIAARVMAEHEIPTNDLYTTVVDNPDNFSTDGVHYSSKGKTAQAEQVAAVIKDALED
jgi:lysophospholipase L1-like esterase